ncbi:MAG TPA: FAD-dependent oxidoreductase [Baekduia sp.]|nr:FAD-dependent oxidoreductase [Baekduia sp.]
MAKKIVVLGAGIAGLEALATLHAHDDDHEVELVLVAPDEAFTVRALGVGEPFGLGHPHRYLLPDLAARLGARLVRGTGARVDTTARHLVLGDGAELDYDALIVAVGSRAVPAYEHGVSFDRSGSPDDFDEALRDLRDGLAGDVAVVVSPGTRWALPAYELALLLRAYAGPEHGVSLITWEPRPLDAFGGAAAERIAEALDEAGVRWMGDVAADVVSDQALFAGGHWMEAGRIVHLPIAVGPRIPGLPSDEHGFLLADEHGRVGGVDGVWAVGDGTVAGCGNGAVAAQHAARAAADALHRLTGIRVPYAGPAAVCGLLRTARGPLYLRAYREDPDASSTWSDSPLWWPPSKVAAPWLMSVLVKAAGPRPGGAGLAVGQEPAPGLGATPPSPVVPG